MKHIEKKIVLLLFVIFLVGCDNRADDFDNLDVINQNEFNSDNEIETEYIEIDETGQIEDININSNNSSESINDSANELLEKELELEKSTLNTLSDFERGTPISIFTNEEIKRLGVDYCNGTNEEIAECILNWQYENMLYVLTAENVNFNFAQSYELRWNEYLPGIYSARDIIENKILPDGRIYGVCWEYAIIYCSIANYYGLECRINSLVENLNDEIRPGGLSEDEYSKLKLYLDRSGLEYDYEAVRMVVPDDSNIPGHYWAEVKLKNSDNKYIHEDWLIADASNQKYNGRDKVLNYISEKKSYTIVDWKLKNKILELDKFQLMHENGELVGLNTGNNSDFEEFLQGREFYEDDLEAGRIDFYEGITDELGNEHRAATMDDFMQGKGLVPYFSECEDICSYMNIGSGCVSMCEDEDIEMLRCYERCAEQPFYVLCDFICEDAITDSEWTSCYHECSGANIVLECDDECAYD